MLQSSLPHPELAALCAGGARALRCGRGACWAGGVGRRSRGRPGVLQKQQLLQLRGRFGASRRPEDERELGAASALPTPDPPPGDNSPGQWFPGPFRGQVVLGLPPCCGHSCPEPTGGPASLPGAGVGNPSLPNRGHTEDRPVPKVPRGQDNWGLQLTPCLPGTQLMPRQAGDLQPGPREGAARLQAATYTSAGAQGWTEQWEMRWWPSRGRPDLLPQGLGQEQPRPPSTSSNRPKLLRYT